MLNRRSSIPNSSFPALLLAAPALLAMCGCGPNAYTLNQQNETMAQQQQALAMQTQQFQQRAATLDKDNQELEALLAQSRQQVQLMKDELVAVRVQLRGANEQLAGLKTEKSGLEKQTRALAASVERRAGATIRANNSFVGNLTAPRIDGVEVRQDGDVVRIELPGEKLFHQGSSTLQPGATQIIDGVMADVIRNYPDQRIGIEGHTDSDPIRTAQFASNHHLSTARAMAVFDHLTRRFNLPTNQAFVVGHGSNHPVVSNATSTLR